MATKKRAGRTSAVQYEKMISFMEKHPELGLFKLSGPNAKQKGARLWETLKNELNCAVGPEKSVQKWQSTWSDWKLAIKKKWREIVKEKNKTGGVPSTSKHLLPSEARLLSLLGNSSVDGDGTTPKAGFQIVDIPIEYVDDMGPSTSGTSSTPTPPKTGTKHPLPDMNTSTQPQRKKNRSYEKEILENQKAQLEMYENMNIKLSNISETLVAKNGILEKISESLIKHNELMQKFINKKHK